MDKKEFGLRIRYTRKKLKMNKDDFSEKIGISSDFLNEIECGRKGASFNTIKKICNFSGVSSDYLILGKENLSNTQTPIAEILEEIPYKYNAVILEHLKNLKYIIIKIEEEKES